MHESYQRIADEEDLAATERDVESDQDGTEDERQDTAELNVDTHTTEDFGDNGVADDAHASEHSTPVQSLIDLDDRTGSFSAPPTMGTMDFIQNEMSDRVLAAKLTPHVVNRAKDRERLLRLRIGGPINFEGKLNGKHANGERSELASIMNRPPISFDSLRPIGANGSYKARSDASVDVPRNRGVRAFSLASRRREQGNVPEYDSGSDTPDELRGIERTINLIKSNRRKNQIARGIEYHEPRSESKPGPFSRARNRPRPFGSPAQLYDDQQPVDDPTVASVSSVHSEPVSISNLHQHELEKNRRFLTKWRKEAAQKKAEKARENNANLESHPVKQAAAGVSAKPQNGDDNRSEIDWAEGGADIPMPSIENRSTPRDTPPPKVLPSPISKQKSTGHMQRWGNNDFTGMSFQVSESPPVRSRNHLNDLLMEKEIEGLTKQAVTSSRLDEIRVKDPNVVMRKSSRNFSPEERRSAPPEESGKSPESRIDEAETLGQTVPDTPVVVYRSSSQNTDNSKASEGSMPDSLDQLKRLARAVSTTPKSSPALHQMVREVEEASAISLPPSEENEQMQAPERRTNGLRQNHRVAETPKIVGAWTDTILPDTIKTQKQAQKMPKYTQTPHVNAGGWIDTPLPNGDRAAPGNIPSIVEEETEETTDGDILPPAERVAELLAESDHLLSERAEDEQSKSRPQPSAGQQVVLPPSALTNVLNEAKQKRLVSSDITDARQDSHDDTETLNLGDATIQSMEDLLNDAADITADVTTLIRANAREEVLVLQERERALASDNAEDGSTSDSAFLSHLTSRMERLMSNLHEARRGISRLEQKVSHTPAVALAGADRPPQALAGIHDPTQPCAVCGRSSDDLNPHVHTTKITSFLSLPIAHATFTLPIPLLFHPRTSTKDPSSKSPTRLSAFIPGPPTWLGYLTITIWTWYILECVMTELYAHPIYAERYVFPPPGIREPEFPFVLPTMLYRWSLGNTTGQFLTAPLLALSHVLWRLVVAVYRVLAMAVGWSDGFVDDDRAERVLTAATKSAMRMVESVLPGGAEGDLSMMNDEML